MAVIAAVIDHACSYVRTQRSLGRPASAKRAARGAVEAWTSMTGSAWALLKYRVIVVSTSMSKAAGTAAGSFTGSSRACALGHSGCSPSSVRRSPIPPRALGAGTRRRASSAGKAPSGRAWCAIGCQREAQYPNAWASSARREAVSASPSALTACPARISGWAAPAIAPSSSRGHQIANNSCHERSCTCREKNASQSPNRAGSPNGSRHCDSAMGARNAGRGSSRAV